MDDDGAWKAESVMRVQWNLAWLITLTSVAGILLGLWGESRVKQYRINRLLAKEADGKVLELNWDLSSESTRGCYACFFRSEVLGESSESEYAVIVINRNAYIKQKYEFQAGDFVSAKLDNQDVLSLTVFDRAIGEVNYRFYVSDRGIMLFRKREERTGRVFVRIPNNLKREIRRQTGREWEEIR